MIVKSIAGKDSGRYSVVISCREGFVMICDGKHHKLSSPKRKNLRHVEPTDRLEPCVVTTDKAIRKLLWEYNCGKALNQ